MSDLYDRCPHNERPSRCLACAHDTIERLHSDVADLMAAKLAEQRQTVQMSRMYDGVVDLLRELRPLLDRDDLKRHYVAVRDRIDAALAGTAVQPEAAHHDLCASHYWNYTHAAQAAMQAAGEWPPACNCRATPDPQSESRDG